MPREDASGTTYEGEFECCKCGHLFKAAPGPGLHCPKCGSLYAKWLDYEERWKLT
jgi:uncharacterized C2H2 Zn-finger protein